MKTLLVLVVLAMAQPLHAQSSETLARCDKRGQLAETVMTQRQNGLAISTLLAIAESSENAVVRDLVVGIVIEAYDRPRFTSDEYQVRAIQDFRNDMELQCLKTFK
jgi:hypothetical protein